MKLGKTLLFALVLLCGLATAQKKPANKPAPAPSPSPVVVTDDTSWPLPLAERDKFRDLQHEDDQIEIENQKMLLKIEQNMARQRAILEEETTIATDFARSKNLEPAQVELDPAKIVLRKKKAK